jgi:hypothetical protein
MGPKCARGTAVGRERDGAYTGYSEQGTNQGIEQRVGQGSKQRQQSTGVRDGMCTLAVLSVPHLWCCCRERSVEILVVAH